MQTSACRFDELHQIEQRQSAYVDRIHGHVRSIDNHINGTLARLQRAQSRNALLMKRVTRVSHSEFVQIKFQLQSLLGDSHDEIATAAEKKALKKVTTLSTAMDVLNERVQRVSWNTGIDCDDLRLQLSVDVDCATKCHVSTDEQPAANTLRLKILQRVRRV